MASTVRQVVNDALNVLGEVAGAGVSAYSEDRMMADAIRSFNLLFKKYAWPHMLEWSRFELDGVTGVPPVDTFAYVRDIEDFINVYRDGESRPLPNLPKTVNPFTLGTGSEPRYWGFQPVTAGTYDNRFLQIWPKQTTGFINVCARVYPLANGRPWDWSDEMPLDHDMLVCGTAWHTLASDDINPGAQDAQRNMMEMRYKDILAAFANQPIGVHGGTNIPMTWTPYP